MGHNMSAEATAAKKRAAQAGQLSLDLLTSAAPDAVPAKVSRAIESDDFPFDVLSTIAESESWRKEIHRPLSHIHKWWAQRLGSVFRAIVLGALAPKGANVMDLFYSQARFPNATVFDPFMGSGTTIIEALKLGARVIGCDINPVAFFLVRNAVARHDRSEVMSTFEAIEQDVASKVQSFYLAQLPDGSKAPVLYYFWVKQLDCPACGTAVDVFPSYVFAHHAYPRKFPEAQSVCPLCGAINCVSFGATGAVCKSCCRLFNPSAGPARGQKACCPACSHAFSISKRARDRQGPPAHRLYAKLVLLPGNRKEYLPANDFDHELFGTACEQLAMRENAFPIVGIEPGYNTNQALNYNYRHWHEFFNPRQLLCLSLLAERIRAIARPELRELFTCLFSGALEFNNMFASYKGEGTGAVRHMFSHHILKPERMPLEANLWGTPKSSGAFSTMFETRILRALDYADNPFELRRTGAGRSGTEKVFGLAEPIGYRCTASFEEFEQRGRVYLACGNSNSTDVAAKSVDAILTDPPFFDNVHYSQLADFFHVWQRHILGTGGCRENATTRATGEVQHSEGNVFQARLQSVWQECHRVLKDDGLLVFTYHHSRIDGWRCILQALMDGGFHVVAVHPIKAEMSVATPKRQTRQPIDLDIIIVCRKVTTSRRRLWNGDVLASVAALADRQLKRLRASHRSLSRNDIRIVVMSHLLRQLSLSPNTDAALSLLDAHEEGVEKIISDLFDGDNGGRKKRVAL